MEGTGAGKGVLRSSWGHRVLCCVHQSFSKGGFSCLSQTRGFLPTHPCQPHLPSTPAQSWHGRKGQPAELGVRPAYAHMPALAARAPELALEGQGQSERPPAWPTPGSTLRGLSGRPLSFSTSARVPASCPRAGPRPRRPTSSLGREGRKSFQDVPAYLPRVPTASCSAPRIRIQ